jgi:Sulfotransferase domain
MATGSTQRAPAAWVSRQRWTLERFGLSPGKLPRRISDQGAPRVFCVSIPKSGTHLLERALCLHPALYRKIVPTVSGENIGKWNGLAGLVGRIRPGQVVVSHLRHSDQDERTLDEAGVRGLFMVRNPRDLVVSQIHYVTKRADHRLHDLFSSLPDARARLRLAITGDAAAGLPSIAERLSYFEGWLRSDLLMVRFEDLVGSAGGGDAGRQRDLLRSVFTHLGVDASDERVRAVAGRLFSSDSPTFRAGQVGSSRDFFDDELEELFRRTIGDHAVPYGYDV